MIDGGGKKVEVAAEAYEPTTGRVLEVLTDQPGIQFYTGNFLDGTVTGKGGKVYNRRDAFCLETQHYPDSPNHPAFPDDRVKAGREVQLGYDLSAFLPGKDVGLQWIPSRTSPRGNSKCATSRRPKGRHYPDYQPLRAISS